jgi:hypothetical protein
VLQGAATLATPEASAAARAAAEQLAPGPLSTRFARDLRERLGLDLATAGTGATTAAVRDALPAGAAARARPDLPVAPR